MGVLTEYRLAGGSPRWSTALVWDPAARAAIAGALGVPPTAVVLKKRPWHPPRIVEEQLTPTEPPQSRPKRAWSMPHIVEEALGPEEFREMAQLLPTTRVWRKPCVVELPLEPPAAGNRMRGREICIPAARDRCAKPLSFAAMLREDEGEGVLVTEFVCQSDWGPSGLVVQFISSEYARYTEAANELVAALSDAGFIVTGPERLDVGNPVDSLFLIIGHKPS